MGVRTIFQIDTSVLRVEWLGDECVKLEVVDSSADGSEVCVFHAKNLVTIWWGFF